MKNIALLKGINVGVKNKIAMTELKKTLKKKGIFTCQHLHQFR